jgi:Radical SAM superfamily
MVYRGRLDDRPALLSVKNTSISLAFEAEWVAAWDFGGRLYSLWKHGHTYRRGLNGRVLHKWHESDAATEHPEPADPRVDPERLNPYDARRRVSMEGGAVDAIVQETADAAARLQRAFARNIATWTNAASCPPDPNILTIVERCARFDAQAARVDAARFAEVYSPVGILPPDQYLSTVLQATDGCSFGTCTFCDLYHGAYRVKSSEQFRRHAEAVREYLGDSASLRGRSFFLGSANALAVPMERLVEFFVAIPGLFDTRPRPVHAFVDGFTGLRKTAADYAELRSKGLGRVYVGLESGHDPLLAFVRKPASREQAVETVRTIKAGGAPVGVIVMIGLGGHAFAAGHVRDTTAAVSEMGLGPTDLLFFSDLVEVPGTEYPQAAAARNLHPLSLDERLAQMEAIRAGLVFEGPPPQVARYDVREFVY